MACIEAKKGGPRAYRTDSKGTSLILSYWKYSRNVFLQLFVSEWAYRSTVKRAAVETTLDTFNNQSG